MKCETKAKRRVTLSICGLGMLNETEVETIRQEAPPLIIEAAPNRPPAPDGFVYIERLEARRTKDGTRNYANVTLSTGEVVLAFGQMVKLLEGLAQDQSAVQLTMGKTKSGFAHIVEAHTANGLMTLAAAKTQATAKGNVPF